jgi:hypothetical protein
MPENPYKSPEAEDARSKGLPGWRRWGGIFFYVSGALVARYAIYVLAMFGWTFTQALQQETPPTFSVARLFIAIFLPNVTAAFVLIGRQMRRGGHKPAS